MPDERTVTLANRPFVVAITIPVTAAPVTVESLATGLTAALNGGRVVSFSIEQGAAAFNWGHSAAACVGLVALGVEKEFPTLGIGQTYVKSTTAGTVAAVLVCWIVD